MRYYAEAVFDGEQRHPRGYEIRAPGLGRVGIISDAILAHHIVHLLNDDLARNEKSRPPLPGTGGQETI